MIQPKDHFAAIEIRPMGPLPERTAHPLVPRYAIEPDHKESGGDDSEVSSVVQIFNNNLSNVLTLIQNIQDQIDGFEIECNADGTLSWHFGDEGA